MGFFEKTGVHSLPRKMTSSFSKLGPTTCSEMFVDTPRVVTENSMLCKMFCKFPEDCSAGIIRVESAGDESGDCSGEKDLA